jgi:hypothetical protein
MAEAIRAASFEPNIHRIPMKSPGLPRADRRSCVGNMMTSRVSRAVPAALVLVLVACDAQQRAAPAAPSTPVPPSPPPASTISLSGTTLEYTAAGPRPLPNVALVVRTFPGFLQVTSDAAGRYSLSGVPLRNDFRSVTVSVAPALGSGYYAPCPNGGTVNSDRIFDVHLVSAALLSTAGPPSMLPRLESIWVSGTVFENTPQGVRPIAGASVRLVDAGPAEDASDPRFSSNTLTDAAGRYLVCPPIPGTGTDTYGAVRVDREGYQPASRLAFLGWDYDGIDIALVRN